MLEPVGAEAVQRASRKKERRRHAELAQDRQRRVDVARQVVVEGHRHAGPSRLATRCASAVRCQECVQRDEVDDLAERLQLRSEHILRDRWNDLASRRSDGPTR